MNSTTIQEFHQIEWFNWAIMIGIALVTIGVVAAFVILSKVTFRKQLEIVQAVMEDSAHSLYLSHLPLLTQHTDQEVARIEQSIQAKAAEHDKDILFLLQENERLEGLLKGRVSEGALQEIKLSREEQTERALKLLLSRIRDEANNTRK